MKKNYFVFNFVYGPLRLLCPLSLSGNLMKITESLMDYELRWMRYHLTINYYRRIMNNYFMI